MARRNVALLLVLLSACCLAGAVSARTLSSEFAGGEISEQCCINNCHYTQKMHYKASGDLRDDVVSGIFDEYSISNLQQAARLTSMTVVLNGGDELFQSGPIREGCGPREMCKTSLGACIQRCDTCGFKNTLPFARVFEAAGCKETCKCMHKLYVAGKVGCVSQKWNLGQCIQSCKATCTYNEASIATALAVVEGRRD